MFRFGLHPYLIMFALILLLVIGLFCFALIKLFLRFNKKQRIVMTSVVALCAVFGIGWFLPIGTLTGTWLLSSDFGASPRNITPAPQMIQFSENGSGMKINHDGYEIDFEWYITPFEEYFFYRLL